MFNVLNGGKHASNAADFQEFKLVPAGAPTFREALRYGVETYHVLAEVWQKQGASIYVGDEGGYAPRLASNAFGLDATMKAIERAGFRPGEDIWIALDPAASSLYDGGMYSLERDSLSLSREEMIDYWQSWARKYPLISLEDPLADSDWEGFADNTAKLGAPCKSLATIYSSPIRGFLNVGFVRAVATAF
jgi:enolase